MKKNALFVFVLFIAGNLYSQIVNKKPVFQQSQMMQVTMETKSTISQQAGGQSIDFNVNGSAVHSYKVTNTNSDNSTLHHEAKRIKFDFDGMGQSKSFDSDIQKDMDGPLGKPIQETLKKTFDMIVDSTGKVLLVKPEKFAAEEMEGPMKLMANMLKDVLSVVEPPAMGTNSIFKILPDHSVNKGDTWSETVETAEGKINNNYTLSDVTDSTLIVDITGTSVTNSKLEIMAGMEIAFLLNNKSSGKIIIDRKTNFPKERVLNTESNGTMQGLGGETPIISKSTITTKIEIDKASLDKR